MPGLLSWRKSKPNSTPSEHATVYQYSTIGVRQIRLLRYGSDSMPDAIRLEIKVFDRNAAPPYAALSYVCGEQDPMQKIEINGRTVSIGPNLCNALFCMRDGLAQWFWSDAICINQCNNSERNEQVRVMADTYANAMFVASWVGLCNESLESIFTLNTQSTRMNSLSRSDQKRINVAIERLTELQYWKRIWIQQELLLNDNVVLFCGFLTQPLHPLIEWMGKQYEPISPVVFDQLSDAVEWYRWRKAPVLRLLTWAGHLKHQSTDPLDKLYALLSQVASHELNALQPYFPDYGLTLSQMLMVTLVHIRRFSGQKRASLQLDSVLNCFDEPGDSACSKVVRSYYWSLRDADSEVSGQRSIRLSSRDRRALKAKKLLNKRMNMLDVCDCLFSQKFGPAAGARINVHSSRTWQRSQVWVFDPPLSQELNRFWLESSGRVMEGIGQNNRR